MTGLDALRKATTSFDDEPCDQKEGSCLVAGAVESDRDVTGSGTFWGNLLLIGCICKILKELGLLLP